MKKKYVRPNIRSKEIKLTLLFNPYNSIDDNSLLSFVPYCYECTIRSDCPYPLKCWDTCCEDK